MRLTWRAWHPDIDIVNPDVGPIDFFIVGMLKCGTTALDQMLRRAPAIQMADQKEMWFFSNPHVDWQNQDYRLLHLFFDWTKRGVLRGEATPSYAYLPHTLERIKDYNPKARLIVSLRHPSYRAYSHWRMQQALGHDSLPFHEAIHEGRQRLSYTGPHSAYSYVEQGFYVPLVRRILDLFPRHNVLFLRNDWLWLDPNTQAYRICSFLGVEPPAEVERKYVTLIENKDRSTIPLAHCAYLDELYADDILETAQLTAIDLSDWLSPEYIETVCQQ